MDGDVGDSDLPSTGYVRHLLLDPVTTALLFVLCAVLINLLLMWSQGGPDRMREIIAHDIAAAKTLREKQSADRQRKQMQDWFDARQRNPDDDNYAK